MNRVHYLFDEDCNARILRGLLRRVPSLRVITAQELGLGNSTDQAILAFAAAEGCIVVSHDVRTMTAAAAAQLRAKQPIAGLILIPQAYPVGHAIEDLLLIAEVTTREEWEGKIVFLPL